ncbi:MAG: DUF4838 domain-containing protein, partial [Armatimonadota bacterium]|nr:DUF4838 domain-containing protein [Armatimonadota bacterium]
MNTTILLAVIGAVSLAASAAEGAQKMVLADRGRSQYTIRLCANPTVSEEYAALELQRLLKEITGAELPIQRAGSLPLFAILVGPDETADYVAPGIPWDELGEEGFVVRREGDRLVLAGQRPRGTLYAVYSFLDQEVGCRWLAPDCAVIPKKTRLELGKVRRTHVPRLEYRETFSYTGFDGDWAARNFSNGHAARLEERHGGKIVYQGFVHTFYTLLPPSKHFAAHPEWYSERNGQRFHERGQLCLTNPEVLQQVIEGVRGWLKEHPEARIVSISQNDWAGWCECAKCKAVDEEEGSHSGTVIRFVNQVAEALEKEFPDVAFDT